MSLGPNTPAVYQGVDSIGGRGGIGMDEDEITANVLRTVAQKDVVPR